MTVVWVGLAVWVALACALALWLGPRLRRTDVRDRQRWQAPRTLPGQRTPGEEPDGRRGGRGAA